MPEQSIGFDALRGQRVLVTGSSRGLGRTIARYFSALGARVAVNGRNADAVARLASELAGAVAAAGDVERADSCRAVVESALAQLGGLDVLVTNVGSGRSMPPGEETEAEWQRVLSLNLSSATNAVAAARGALAQQGGTVVCISSICGVAALGAPITYSAAKAALHAFVRGSARPLALQGIRINAVAPGNLLFEGSVWEQRLHSDAAAVQAMLERDVALARLGTADEIASWVVFLASPLSSFATGQVFVVDGGQIRSTL